MLHLRTERLQLVAVTLELARAELADARRLEKLLGAHVPPSWPPPLNDERTQRWTVDALTAHPERAGWFAWYFIHREHGELRLIGCGGFTGPPTPEGTVEIGYGIVPECHRFGFAPEAVRALVAWAFGHREVRRVIAQTLPELRPSIRVLEKCGFAFTGAGGAASDGGSLGLALAVLPFVLSTTLTPGPNTILVTASGATFGFRRTIPGILGILVGFPLVMIAVGLGLGALFALHPAVHAALRGLGAVYLLFLAWKIATTKANAAADARGRPLTFLQTAAFQWVNPKAWIMSIGAITTFTTVGGDTRRETLVIAAVFALVTLPAICAWALFGAVLGRFLRSERALRIFNLTMAALLVASLVPLFL